MIRLKLIVFLSTIIFFNVKAQEYAIGKIEYEEKILFKSESAETISKFSKSYFELYLGKESSHYIRKPVNNTVKFSENTDTSKISNDNLLKIKQKIIEPIKIRTGTTRKRQYSSDVFITQEITQEEEKLIIKDTLIKINWNITEEHKKIANFDCQKAYGRFKGRNYEAWFTLSIPLPSGPWKLGGLPGLILEAKDDLNEVFFNLVAIEIPLKISKEIPKILEGSETTLSKFIEKNNKLAEKSNKMLRSMNKNNKVINLGRNVAKELSEQ